MTYMWMCHWTRYCFCPLYSKQGMIYNFVWVCRYYKQGISTNRVNLYLYPITMFFIFLLQYVFFLCLGSKAWCSGERTHSPPTNMAEDQIPASTQYVGWVCCWLTLLCSVRFFSGWYSGLPRPLLINQHFQNIVNCVTGSEGLCMCYLKIVI